MSIPGGQEQQNLSMWAAVEKHLFKHADEFKDNITDYEWEFLQDQQIIEPFQGDDLEVALNERLLRFKRYLPSIMRGVDFRT